MRPGFISLLLPLSLAACLLLPVLAQTAPTPAVTPASMVIAPATDPARQALDAWLDAFNSNDRARLQAYRDRYQPKLDVDDMLDFHRRTGGFRLIRREPAALGTARILVQEMDAETVGTVSVTLRKGTPLLLSIRPIERPDDLRIPRLDQVGAIAALVARADATAAKDAFSGVLLVARGDQVLLQRAWGLVDRANGTPVTLDTKFRLGAMNKMFTAVAALQLVQAGKLSLDDYVDQHVFALAGMHDTGSLPEDVAVPGRSHAYTRKDDQWMPPTSCPTEVPRPGAATARPRTF